MFTWVIITSHVSSLLIVAAGTQTIIWRYKMSEPFELTISEASALIKLGELSPVELTQSLIERSNDLDPKLSVWVTMDPELALAAATEAEREISELGYRGPMHGIPIGIKDIFNTKDMLTTSGSKIYADFVPDYDSTAVALLKKAGAIILGKAVTTEFASGDPSPTKNPWNVEHTPGGSSSGSAAGVAARMFLGALGTQTGGSVLRPASYNGTVGLKPTFGRISRHGVTALAWSLDTMGMFTRSVADSAILLQALAGHDPKDNSTSKEPVPDYVAQAKQSDNAPRIGVLRQFFFEECDDEVRAHIEAAVKAFESAGAQVVEVSAPFDFETVLAAQRVLMSVEGAAYHQEVFEERSDDYSPFIRDLIEAGMLTPAVTYVQSQRMRRKFRNDMMAILDDVDVILTPTTPSAAPKDLTSTGDPKFQSPWTTFGLPTITIPSGLAANGLPLGIQIGAAPFDEGKLFSVARWCEDVLDVDLLPDV